MTRTLALARMRVAAYVAGQRALMPNLLAVALVFVAHAGGRAPAAEAYGFSAVLLFGALAWQTKVVLDVEPDSGRLVTRSLVGSFARELGAGLVAAAVVAVPMLVLAVVVPPLLGAVDYDSLPVALARGAWVHVLAAAGAVAVGALASRAIVRRAGWAAVVLLAGAVLLLVLGSQESGPWPWLVPGLFTTIRAAEQPGLGAEVGVTVHAVAWSLILLSAYTLRRRDRP